jgi:DNA invertase Pin-like site-specific DNA recombinase
MTPKRRCAIYTRKSTEEGLEQAFNSLDAQRDACAAYILSQTHEGWELVNEQYDDGGWSGGNMQRPALQQLLTDVAAGKVGVIVVYKVDRLTRSLADFARIVDTLDEAGASFVSVTQAFNTTSSMGRLTLNVLLSFAQFEREVTSERIRDKFAASKRKGIFMGGPVPIGYRLEGRRLIVDEIEAATVRMIFERYLALRSIGRLGDELAEAGVRTKLRHYKDGSTRGAALFHHGPLSYLLKNPVYIGKVAQNGEFYDGEHAGIIAESLWREVQATLANNRHQQRLGKRTRHPSLLTGLLTDPDGRLMSPTFTTKGSRRHHYYVSRIRPGEDRNSIWRVPAGEIDRAVLKSVADWLRSRERLSSEQDASAVEMELEANAGLADALAGMSIAEQRAVLLEQGLAAQLAGEQLVVHMREERASIELPATLARRGSELKLVVPADQDTGGKVDPVLLKLVLLALAARQSVLTGEADPLVSHYSKRHLSQLLRVSWLAPDLLTAILEGHHPPTLTGRKLLRATDVPLDWAGQRRVFNAA